MGIVVISRKEVAKSMKSYYSYSVNDSGEDIGFER